MRQNDFICFGQWSL